MVWNPFAAFWPNSSILPDTCEHMVRLGMLCYMLSILFPWGNSKWKDKNLNQIKKENYVAGQSWAWCLAVHNILYQDGTKQIRSIRFTIHLIKAFDVGVVVNNFFFFKSCLVVLSCVNISTRWTCWPEFTKSWWEEVVVRSFVTVSRVLFLAHGILCNKMYVNLGFATLNWGMTHWWAAPTNLMLIALHAAGYWLISPGALHIFLLI